MSKVYTDVEVVAAINSCIDFRKLAEIPSGLVDRFKLLLQKKRIGAVCFFYVSGFGLRVYNDAQRFVLKQEGDIATLEANETDPNHRIDLEPLWVVCDPKAYLEKRNQVSYIIARANGKQFYSSSLEEDDGAAEISAGWKWTRFRSDAKTFSSIDEALEVCRKITPNGGSVVLEKD